MNVSGNNLENNLMNQDLDLIEGYLNERFELERNELMYNLEPKKGRYKFNYSQRIDTFKEFTEYYRILFHKLSLISINSFKNKHDTILVNLCFKNRVLSQIEELGL